MRNCIRSITLLERGEIMTKFARKLKNSGYSVKQRKEIIGSGLSGYYRMVSREQAGGRKVNRPREESEYERNAKTLT